MKKLIYSFCFLLCIGTMSAQHLKGTIVNKKGEPIPNSTIYIYEASRGIAADDLGQFQTTLQPGNYTCEFRSLGYESQKKTIEMGNTDLSIHIELQEKAYVLNEVIVYPDGEDPAYRIMRKAIAYAPYHRYQVKKYSSEAYIKGSLIIDKIPAIFKRAMKVNGENFDINSLIGKPLLMESKSEINFTSPETYNQKVLALKTSMPKEFGVSKGLSIMTSSIYNAKLDDRISPLSSGAFRFYAFKLEDVDYKEDFIVNKIRVIPRKKNPSLFSGYLYILENTWNVYIADLTTSELGTSLHYRINYHPVKAFVYLPTTYDISMKMNTMGVKGSGRYFASIKYNTVEVDENRKPSAVAEKNIEAMVSEKAQTPRQQKIFSEIEKLSQKEKLSTKDAYKMSKLMSEATEPEEVKKQRESLEIKDIENVKMEVDTFALKRDSIYWAAVRELPLHEDEIKSYQLRDSIAAIDSTNAENDKNEVVLSIDDNPKTAFGRIIQGGRWKINDKMLLQYGGLFGALKEYNFVDGFWLGQSLTYNYAINKQNSFSISPSVYYATARKEALWHASATVNYAPMLLGRFSASAGHISRDINAESGESRLMNSIAALDLGQNFIRFYDSHFFRAENRIDIANGLHLYTNVEIDKRSSLSNATTYNFMKKEIPENIPSQTDLYETHTASAFSLGISYTPFYRYRISNGRKWYVSSKYPTFSLTYKKGMNLFGDKNGPSYDRIESAISQTIEISPFENLNYKVSGGTFLSNKRLHINDLKYFSNNLMLFTRRDFSNSFNLLSPYTASNQWWAEGHLNFQSNYLFLKNLPFLQNFAFDESVHLHALSTENLPLYIEGGYSIGFLGLGRVGVLTGFNEGKFDRVGFRISYPLFNMMERPLK